MAEVSLPRLSFLEQSSSRHEQKICYGDLHRARAPAPPPEFVPDERMAASIARSKESARAYRESRRPPDKPRRSKYVMSERVRVRMLELVRDYRKSQRETAEILTREFPDEKSVITKNDVYVWCRELRKR